jgi:hypothetical protein
MSRSPEMCVECRHLFPSGAPEPSWCPACGRLCSALDEPEEPAEIAEEFGVRVVGRIFWIIFFGVPLAAGAAAIVPRNWTLGVAAKLGLPVLINPATLPITVLCGGAVCAGWVLARMAGRTFLERAVITVLGGAIVMIVYACMARVGAAMVSYWTQ